MLAVTALQVLCAIGAVYFGSRAGMGFGRDLRSAIFDHVTGFSAEETARFGAPSLLTRTTNDVQQIQLLVQLTCTMLITAPIMCVGGIVDGVHQDAGLSWLLLVSVPLLALANYWIVSHLLPIFRRMQRLIDGINRVMREQLSGIRVVRAFAREPFERSRFDEANAALADTALAAGRWQALMLPVTTLVINISSVALIWFGGMRIDAGQMQVGSLIAFLSYFMQILMAVLMATLLLVMLPRASVCAERITEVLNTEPPITSPGTSGPTARRRGEIALRGATFSYPGAERPVLQDVSLTAQPGTTTAIVGSQRVRQVDAGVADLPAVRRDGRIGARRRYRRSRLRHRTAVVGDRAGAPARLSVLRHRRRQPALRQGRRHRRRHVGRAAGGGGRRFRPRRTPTACDMRVAQGGINFSGGQRQRLAIARAVIRRPAVYLFDDAFSALDVHTDARVRAALREVSADATVIIVSQRISTVAEADQIIVIDDGRVVGAGTHDVTAARLPAYAEFADSQSVGVADDRTRCAAMPRHGAAADRAVRATSRGRRSGCSNG